MFFRDNGLEKTKKITDEVIESIAEKIKDDYMEPKDYARVIQAYTELITVRMDMI